jgi:hypothetical protein
MKRTFATACALAILSATVWAQQSPPPAPTAQTNPPGNGAATGAGNGAANGATSHPAKKKASHKDSKVPSQQLPDQTMPPVPATLMNSDPVKPNVTMESGMLTIDAPNSTLSDVLNGIHSATGAVIEGVSPTERVVVKLGPGNPDQVIAALLRGTPYDYVILGTLGKRDNVARVLLSQQQFASAEASHPPTETAPPPTEPQPDESLPERTLPDDIATRPSPENNAAEQAQRQQQQEQQQQEQQLQQQQAQQQQTQQQQTQQPQPDQQDPNAPKSPEQLFKELQQLEQQKQTR